jgi:hypothetical protein
METNRRLWNGQHAVLQRLLMKEKNFPKALPLLLEHHAAVHSAKISAGKGWSFQDEVLGALTEAQWRAIPPGGQSAVWKLWHATRVEDVTMNLLLAGSPQVLLGGKWLRKLGIAYADVGNDLPAADLKKLSESIDVKALLAYRLAVGRRTRTILRRLKPGGLWEPPAPERIRRIAAEKAVREKARWLLKYWGGNPAANLLLMPATRHPFVHLNEISRMIPPLRMKTRISPQSR